MAHTFRTIILCLVLAAVLAGSVAADGAANSEADHHRSMALRPSDSRREAHGTVIADPLTADQQEMVDWAVGRFAEAGLALPELTVRFDPTRELCGHHDGLYQENRTAERLVTICAPNADTFAAKLQARRTLLHEFAHAWDLTNLTEGDREQLTRTLGADTWDSADVEWEARGVERFAESFVFALLDQPRRLLKVSVGCANLLDAFHTTTGAAPLGPGVPTCTA